VCHCARIDVYGVIHLNHDHKDSLFHRRPAFSNDSRAASLCALAILNNSEILCFSSIDNLCKFKFLHPSNCADFNSQFEGRFSKEQACFRSVPQSRPLFTIFELYSSIKFSLLLDANATYLTLQGCKEDRISYTKNPL
jgi:hypothetical protein